MVKVICDRLFYLQECIPPLFFLINHQRDNESILCGGRNGMQGEEERVVTGGGTDGFL